MLLACFFALGHGILFAQAEKALRVLHTTEKSANHVPPQEAPAGLKKIYSNLGEVKLNLYNDTDGWGVAGPNSAFFEEFTAMPFTPKTNSHVSQVQVAVAYLGSGANQVNLSIYADASGTPGTLLAGPVTVTNLPEYGTCCTLAVASFTPLAVTGGTRYWVVADTPLSGTGSDFVGGWNWVVDPFILVGSNFDGGGWTDIDGNGRPAGEVLGTIP